MIKNTPLFSNKYYGTPLVFHHDTFLHSHLITTDKSKMGHLDEALFKKGTMKLYLPTH